MRVQATKKRVATARLALTIPFSALALLTYVACSGDDTAPSSPDGGSSLPDGATGDSGSNGSVGPSDGGTDADADAAFVCDDDGGAVDCSYVSDSGTDAGILPGDLRCTGLYSCWSPKTVAANALAYTPGVELWSDGADKSRWLVLPPGTKIDITQHDGWVFPVGTKAFKEFKVAGKRLETRIFQKVADATWESTVYRWSDDGESSAKRLDTGELVDGYEIPAASACNTCHRGRADHMLGIEEWSLSIATAQGLTTGKMKDLGLLTPAPATTTMTIPEDATGKAAAAAGWLHANCGFCHNNRTGLAKFSGLFMDLVVDDPDAGVQGLPVWQTAMNQPLRVGGHYAASPEFAGFLRMKPGDAAHSLVPTVDGIRSPDGGIDPNQMPPIISRKVDPKAAQVGAWVGALPP